MQLAGQFNGDILNKRWHENDNVTLETSRYRTKLPYMINSNDEQYYSNATSPNNSASNNSVQYIVRSNYVVRDFKIKDKQKYVNDKKYNKSKKTNKNDLYLAFMAGKSAGLIQGISQSVKLVKK